MATGKGAKFSLEAGAAAVSLTDISSYVRRIESTNNAENVDATVITSTRIEREGTFAEDTLRLTLKWSPAASTFIQAVAADPTGLLYEYGPEGGSTGDVKISGSCNAISVPTIPGSDPRALTELVLELSIVTATFGTFA